MKFSDRILELRKARHITQMQFAKALFVTKQCVWNWENEMSLPSVEMFIKIANYFSVSADYLLGLENKKYLEITGLNDSQIAHFQQLIDDMRKNKKENEELENDK